MIDTRVSKMLEFQSARTSRAEAESYKNLEQMSAALKTALDENKDLRLRILELERAADTDPLLPLYNRRAFIREIDRARNVMGRYDIQSSIIYMDLNDFKGINDRYGHAIGDDLLRNVGKVLIEGVRDCDLVARLGGDEFGILLFKTDAAIAKAKASVLAERITKQTISMPTGDISTSVAWGISVCEMDDTADQIVARADRAMYIAKKRRAELAASRGIRKAG